MLREFPIPPQDDRNERLTAVIESQRKLQNRSRERLGRPNGWQGLFILRLGSQASLLHQRQDLAYQNSAPKSVSLTGLRSRNSRVLLPGAT
jgi:hypothetical protein